ncbi:MAG TPA: metallophosphoesterase [Phycisphaerae bacterium]|nr:metallophosphoesterase [Phycisphaerae bacterium]
MTAIVVRQVNVPLHGLPPCAEGFCIAQLSDLHLRRWGRDEQHLQDLLAHLPCDTLLITGDFGHDPEGFERTAELMRRLLAPVRPPLGIYGVLGNHDRAVLADQELPLTLLRNELRLINVGAFEYYLGGIEQTEGHRSTVSEAIGELPDDAPVVVMAHYPSTVFELPVGAGALMLAGHTHGGQIRLPGLGCLWTNDELPRSMARGLHAAHGNWLHVSPGTGVSGPLPVRWLCPPELTVLRLRRAARIRQEPRITSRAAVSTAA